MSARTESPLPYLVDLLPAVLVPAADGGVVVQQELAAAGVPPHRGRVVQRSQPAAVLGVGRRPELQKGLKASTNGHKHAPEALGVTVLPEEHLQG